MARNWWSGRGCRCAGPGGARPDCWRPTVRIDSGRRARARDARPPTARRGCAIAPTSSSSTPASTRRAGWWPTAGRTGCRRCAPRSNRSTSRRPGCSSRRARGGRCVTAAVPIFDGGQRRAVKAGREAELALPASTRDAELRAQVGRARRPRLDRRRSPRARTGARGGGARRRGAAHHRRRVSGRRDDEHRAHRRAAPVARRRDGGGARPRTVPGWRGWRCWSRSASFPAASGRLRLFASPSPAADQSPDALRASRYTGAMARRVGRGGGGAWRWPCGSRLAAWPPGPIPAGR